MDKNININISANTTGIKSLKAELRETITALQQIPEGSAEFDALAEKAADLKDRMAGVNEQVNALASGSKYEKVTKAFGEMGAGLADMDFDRLVTGSNLFAKSAKAITFKDAIGSIKSMGQAFLTVGKAILTNPLFLLIGLIVAIAAGIVKLMDKLGLLKKIFEFVGDAIDTVVQAIKDFLDWIGLTTFAAEDQAARMVEAQGKIAAAYEEKQARVAKTFDQQIEIAKIEGKNTVSMERQKQFAIIETSRARYKALQEQLEQNKISKTLDEEQVKEIQKNMKLTREGIKDARFEIKKIGVQETEDNKAKNEQIAKDNQAAYKDRLAKQKQYEADRLAASRAIQDIELELMQDGIEKELKANNLKYKRLIEDTKANEKLLASEKAKTIELLQEQERAKQNEIFQKQTDELNASLKASSDAREQKEIEAQAHREEVLLLQQEAFNEAAQAQREKDAANAKAMHDAKFALAEGFIKGLQGLEDLLAASGIKTAGLQKTIALVQIATDTAKSISAVIAGATAAAAAGGPAAPFLIGGYIASGIGTVLAAVASAKKALQSAPSLGGSGGSSPNVSVPSGGGGAQPSFNLFGQGNNANTTGAGQVATQQQITVQAVVSETDMTGTQNRVLQYQNAATL